MKSQILDSTKDLQILHKKYKFVFAAISPLASGIQLNSLESKSDPLSIIDLSVPGYFRKSTIINSNTIIIDMDTIKQSESDYFLILKPTLKKCQYIIDEEINNFVLNHKYRYNLHRAQIGN